MRPSYLMKWNSPAGVVIAPKPHNRRRLLFLPGLRFRTVLLFKGKCGINVHDKFLVLVSWPGLDPWFVDLSVHAAATHISARTLNLRDDFSFSLSLSDNGHKSGA